MSRRIGRLCCGALCVLALVLLLPAGALAAEVAGEALVLNATRLDGTEVTIEGEAIGDMLHSGQGHVWLNVLGSDGVAIGVWVDREDAESVGTLGRWSQVGDTVRVVGVFNAACEQHGGDLDIHANSFEVVSAGYPVEHPADPLWAVLGGLGVVIAFVLSRIARQRRLRAPGASRSPL